jgi:hypothetical protein
MIKNHDAFAPLSGEESVAPSTLRSEGLTMDEDGLLIPKRWRAAPDKWRKLALPVRVKFSESYRQDQQAKFAELPKTAAAHPFATRFTTNYAIKYGRTQGWKLIERERYDRVAKRHYDLMLGVDALFDTPQGMVGIQGAGKSERKAHYDSFIGRGGPETARRRHIRILYLEFERGDYNPIKEEWWVS